MALVLDTFAARLPELGGSGREAFILVEVAGRREGGLRSVPYRDRDGEAATEDRAPLCLALAIDASSSMRGSRFALAIQATRNVLESLGAHDRLAVVTFDRAARVVLGPLAVNVEGKAHARHALDRLATGMGTNLGGGWSEAAEAVLRVMMPDALRRVLVLTDGYPSRGETDPEALRARIAEGTTRGVETSMVGIGDGIDERLCALLAQAGEGRFHYVRDEGGLGDVVAREVEGAKSLAATNVSVVLALSPRVERAEVIHRYPCRPDGRTLEVRIGAVGYEQARLVLTGAELFDGSPDAMLGVAVAQGRRAGGPAEPATNRTAIGYALGSKPGEESDAAIVSERQSLSLSAGAGDGEARRRIAHELLVQRTVAEVRSAWDALDVGDREALERRLDRARLLRQLMLDQRLVERTDLEGLPELDVVHDAMLGAAGEAREARRRFTSWAHNTQVSFIGAWPRKEPPKR